MRKRFGCVVVAALIVAGGAQAQQPESAPFTGPTPQAQNADAGPTAPPAASSPESGILAPIAEWARAFSGPSNFGDAHVWVSADYLFTFMRGAKLPPLVTTSPSNTPRNEAGILGEPTTANIFGGGLVDNDLRAGFQLATGVWLNREQTLGIEGGFLVTSSQATLFSANSTNGAIIARPFIDPNNKLPQAVLVAFPGSSNGSINIRAESGNLYGANLDLTEKAYETDWFRLYALIGYQYYGYNESLRTQQTIAPTSTNFIAGTQINSNDSFTTRNNFHGLDLGLRSQFSIWDSLSLEVLTKVAIGQMHRDVDIAGNTTVSIPGAASVTQPGGVLALSTNSGALAQSDFRAVPEVGINFCWQVRSYLTVRAGWSFIYFNQIARAGDQVDTMINPNLLPGANAAAGGATRPIFNLTRTDMWVQSINLGFEFTY